MVNIDILDKVLNFLKNSGNSENCAVVKVIKLHILEFNNLTDSEFKEFSDFLKSETLCDFLSEGSETMFTLRLTPKALKILVKYETYKNFLEATEKEKQLDKQAKLASIRSLSLNKWILIIGVLGLVFMSYGIYLQIQANNNKNQKDTDNNKITNSNKMVFSNDSNLNANKSSVSKVKSDSVSKINKPKK